MLHHGGVGAPKTSKKPSQLLEDGSENDSTFWPELIAHWHGVEPRRGSRPLRAASLSGEFGGKKICVFCRCSNS